MILHYNTGNGSCQGNLENSEISKLRFSGAFVIRSNMETIMLAGGHMGPPLQAFCYVCQRFFGLRVGATPCGRPLPETYWFAPSNSSTNPNLKRSNHKNGERRSTPQMGKGYSIRSCPPYPPDPPAEPSRPRCCGCSSSSPRRGRRGCRLRRCSVAPSPQGWAYSPHHGPRRR